MARKKTTGAATAPRSFLTITGVGKLDDRNRTLYSEGYARKIAPPNHPLQLVTYAMNLVVQISEWESPDAALQDMETLVAEVEAMRD